jgi:hypothetical protein
MLTISLHRAASGALFAESQPRDSIDVERQVLRAQDSCLFESDLTLRRTIFLLSLQPFGDLRELLFRAAGLFLPFFEGCV